MGGAASIGEPDSIFGAEDQRQMLVSLPAKLIFHILHDWLGSWADISRLDIAYCNVLLRQSLLDVFALEEIRFADNEQIEISKKGQTINFIGFCFSRGLRPTSLVANASSARATAPLRFLGDMPSVRHLRMLASDQEITLDLLYVFMRMFPSIAALDCSQWDAMTDEHVQAFVSLNDSCVEYVKLPLPPSAEASVTSKAIAKLAVHCSSTLRGLECYAQDTSWIGAVAEHCTNIRLLGLPYRGILSETWPAALSTRLEELHLHRSPPGSTDDTATQEAGAALVALAQQCTRLRVLTVRPPLPSLFADHTAALLSRCPSLHWLHVSDFEYRRLPTDVEDLLSLTVFSQGEVADATLHAVLTVLRPPLRSLRAPLSLSTLQLLGSHFGSRLESLDCLGLREDVDLTAWQCGLVEKTPSLRHLSLVDSRNLLPGWLPKLSTYCTRLVSLAVRQSSQLKDNDVVNFLKRIQWRKALRRVELDGSPLLTDAILPALSLLPLQSVQLTGTAISAQGVAHWLSAANTRVRQVVLGGGDKSLDVEWLRR